MTIPLMFLAVVTIVAGFIPFGKFISSNGTAYEIHLDWRVAGTSIVIAVISIAIATAMYARAKQPVANALAHRFRGLWTAAYHRFYIDEVYQFINVKREFFITLQLHQFLYQHPHPEYSRYLHIGIQTYDRNLPSNHQYRNIPLQCL